MFFNLDIVRYTDRYKQTQKQDPNEKWEPGLLKAQIQPKNVCGKTK